MTYKIRLRQAALTGVAAIALTTGPAAYAQQQAAAVEEIVVTGTLIRGIAPVGSNVVGISREDIESSGVIDSNALLATLVPQSEGFMENLEPGRGAALGIPRVPVVRPSLRNMGDSFAGSGSPTLVMLNGARLVPLGIEQSVVDAGTVPPGMVERQEIILDGTSAVYGSDAVGGTINYITRRRFDETRVNATYGFAEGGYYAVSADVTSGKSWNSGGLGLTYSFGKNSYLLEREREFARSRNWFEGGRPTGTACDDHAHVVIGTGATQRRFVTYNGQTTLTERTDWCDDGFNSLTPSQNRHAGFLSFSQDITDRVKLDVTAFYTYRKMTQNSGPFTSTQTVRPTNPYWRSIPGVAAQATQSVSFSYGPVLGNEAQYAHTYSEIGQVTPSFTVDIGSWQARVSTAYGKSKSSVDQINMDTAKQTTYIGGTTLTTAINPYDVNATQNKALIGDLLYHNLRDGIHQFYQVRGVGDGPIFSVPGGEVKAAVGAEWSKTSFNRRITDTTTKLLLPRASASTSSKAVFGELIVPIFGEGNAVPGIEKLTVAVSGRWDDYTDFGDTFNPKIAATYEPVNWITVRGTWGKSFRAPNAVDKLGSSANDIRCVGQNAPGCTTFATDVPPGFVVPPGTNVILNLSGTDANLRPETSKNWSIGADIRPPVVPGLTLSGSYFNIDFKDAIAFPPTNFLTVYNFMPQLIVLSPTAAQIDAFAALAPNGAQTVALVRNSGYNVLYLRYQVQANLARRQVAGLDLSARYNLPTSWGSIDANINGTWRIKELTQVAAGAPVANVLVNGTSRFRMTMGLGVNVGDFRAQATLQHRAGYVVEPSANRVPDQTTIDQFDILNMSFRYNVKGTSALTQDLTVTMTVNNVLDTAPPQNRTTGGGTTNGSTLGRVIQFGVQKKF